MKKILAIPIILAFAALAWSEHVRTNRVQAENQRLTALETDAQQWQTDLAGATNTPDTSGEIERLKTENRDLLKLRNEVRQLREAAAQQDQLLARNARLNSQLQTPAPGAPPGFVAPTFFCTAESLRAAGFQLPRDTVQTMFFAMKNNDLQTFLGCLPVNLPPEAAGNASAAFAQLTASLMNGFTGFSIVSRQPSPPDGFQLTIAVSNAAPVTTAFRLVQTANGWKFDGIAAPSTNAAAGGH